MRKLYPFLCLLSALACRRSEPPPVSFYYWKTAVGEAQAPALARFSPENEPLYLRFFDVDYSAGYGDAVPRGETNLDYTVIDRPVVPVVFITQRVFTQINGAQIDTLAARIARRVDRRLYYLAYHALANANVDFGFGGERRDSLIKDLRARRTPELQIDCDWTAATRDAYFRFLKAFKQQEIAQGRRLSCTIRLHQFRERKQNGIPPVDRGALMCYNVASPKDTSTRNAIFDAALIAGYLKNQPDYPLSLDLALPVFNWGAWFRGGAFMGLLSNWEAPAPTDTSMYKRMKHNIFQVQQDKTIGTNYLRQGDLIRLDDAPEADILSTLPLLRPLLARDGRLLFFDWDTTKIKRYENLVPAAVAGF